MTNIPIDYLQIVLQENIPLSDEEIAHIDKQRREFFKNTTGILMAGTLLIMAIAYYFIQNELINFRYYVLFVFAGFAMFSFFYLIVWLTFRNFKKNWEKDIRHGKNKLSSVIISRHKTENDEYMLTFAGRHKGEKFRIPVKKADYYRYETGAKARVTYLKYSKEALELSNL
ncbi:hypothetical protein SAMN05660461_4947 [Chitinophaga ginsengisegetis]|uniref:Uncharacterized protein n=1 Tax=Chitinophaga ginsengisegetis TaxID=393003 RepID=A0A1T5P9M4_9BACT|nr:hypothetical protein [Chitinophaga ginsengisegetis]SKD09068.1 hypothetical protein SAMN05660461_4947 [Chitinophaga ginsengisegetis]